MEIAAFLRRYPPFSDLPDDRLTRVARSVEIVHLPEGTAMAPSDELRVIRKGIVDVFDGGALLDELGEGELFGPSSLLVDDGPTVGFRVREDTLCYVVPEPVTAEILEMRRSLLSAGTRRLRADAVRGVPEPRSRRVGELVRRPVVTADPGTTIARAASVMADERVSSLLIPMRGAWGILTDRDLRSRVVAAGVDTAGAAETIATFPVRTVDAGMDTQGALTEMFAGGVHHLPVLEGGRLVGVVTDSDLMGIGRDTPFALRGAIGRATTPEELADAGRELPSLVAALVEVGADPLDVARTTALVTDALTERLFTMAFEELGDPPAAFAWLALGSTARSEQALTDHQHHALVFEAPDSDVDGYFAQVAERIAAGLQAAGTPRGPGETMAVSPSMRQPLERWIERVAGGIAHPDPETAFLPSILFDVRRQAGDLDIEPPLDAALRRAVRDQGALARIGRRALERVPPSGFAGGLVVARLGTQAEELDLRHAIEIVTDLSRVWGLAAGATTAETLRRLDAAVEADLLDPTVARELADTLRFLWEVRLRHHAKQIRAGLPPGDAVDPTALGAVERGGLKEAFRVIRSAQRRLEADLVIMTT